MDNEKSAVERLKDKIEAGYKAKYAYWMKQSPEWLVTMADEIVAVKQMREDLADYVSEVDAEYLLRFKDPLEVVSDYWVGMLDPGGNTDDLLSHILWEIQDKREAEEVFALEPEFASADEPSQPATPTQTQQMSM